jgi:hypothetical protein
MTINRQLGAVGRRSRTIEISGGKHVTVHQLVISDFAAIQEEAAHYARRAIIETYTRNADLAKGQVPENEWVAMVRDAYKRAEEITADTISDKKVAMFQDTVRGQLFFIWLGMRFAQPGLTFDQVSELFCNSLGQVVDVANLVAELSLPTLGNDGPPPQIAATGETETVKEPALSTGRG